MRDLGAIWLYIADSSCRGYSPLYDRICRTVAESDEVLDLVYEAPPRGHNPVLLLAAVHYLLLGGLDHPLAAVYAGESEADPGPLFVDLCLEQREALLALLATEQVNTNEVGRSAVIGPALTAVAARLAAPLAHLDVGCSAGLNLLCDRYRLDYGPAGATGPVDAPVEIRCDVVGGISTDRARACRPSRPGSASIALRSTCTIRSSRGGSWRACGLTPGASRGPGSRSRRLGRSHLTLVQGDAVEDVGDLIAGLPSDATAVVTTTWVVGYFSPEQRTGFRDALAAAAASRPVAWISAEQQGVVDVIPSDGAPSDENGVEWSVLGLVTFRDGTPNPSCSATSTPTAAASTGEPEARSPTDLRTLGAACR